MFSGTPHQALAPHPLHAHINGTVAGTPGDPISPPHRKRLKRTSSVLEGGDETSVEGGPDDDQHHQQHAYYNNKSWHDHGMFLKFRNRDSISRDSTHGPCL